MAKLTLETRLTEQKGVTTHTFGHRILYLVAGSYSGSGLSYEDPGPGFVKTYENQSAAWKTLSLAILGTKSLRFAMPRDHEIEQSYLKHTELSNAISQVEIQANSHSPISWDYTRLESIPDYSIHIFDVTVVPDVLTIKGVTWVGLQFSGAAFPHTEF